MRAVIVSVMQRLKQHDAQFQPEQTAVAFLFDRLVGFDPVANSIS